MAYRARRTSPQEQALILETFRRYGKFTQFWDERIGISWVLVDETHLFSITRVGWARETSGLEEEFVVFGRGFAGWGVFRTTEETRELAKSENPSRDPDIYDVVRSFEVTEYRGEPQELLPPAGAVCAAMENLRAYGVGRLAADAFHETYSPAFDRRLKVLNLASLQRLMTKEPAFWSEKKTALCWDFHFTLTTDEEQKRLWQTMVRYSDYNHSNARLCMALTNADRSILLTLSAFMPDGIKHCDEPDDYEYAVISKDTEGVIMVWQGYDPDVRYVKGTLPASQDEIVKMCRFYKCFFYDWCWLYEDAHGRLDENAAWKRAALDETEKI